MKNLLIIAAVVVLIIVFLRNKKAAAAPVAPKPTYTIPGTTVTLPVVQPLSVTPGNQNFVQPITLN